MSDIIEETRLSEQAEQANQNVSQDTEATTVDTEKQLETPEAATEPEAPAKPLNASLASSKVKMTLCAAVFFGVSHHGVAVLHVLCYTVHEA